MTALKFVLYRLLSVPMYLGSTKGRSPLRRVLSMSRLTLKLLDSLTVLIFLDVYHHHQWLPIDFMSWQGGSPPAFTSHVLELHVLNR